MGLLVVLLLTQVVAFAFATLFGKLSEKYDSIKLISVCILGYFAVAIFALFMHSLWQFGIMAFMVGMFQGAIQALSRSYFASIIPQESSGEYFGIYDICGKGASFVGTMLIGITVSLTDSVNIAVSTLAVLFVLGFIFLQLSVKTSKADAKQK
jgi:UMF1 family MFS transporter